MAAIIVLFPSAAAAAPASAYDYGGGYRVPRARGCHLGPFASPGLDEGGGGLWIMEWPEGLTGPVHAAGTNTNMSAFLFSRGR